MKLYKYDGKGDTVAENITVNKKTIMLIAGIAIVFFGMFVMFGQGSEPGTETSTENQEPVAVINGVQEVSLRALRTGFYDKQEVVVKKGIPVKLSFSADTDAGCGKILIMRQFGVQLLSRNGETQVATFTPQQEGMFEYSCSMRMFVGRMKVVA